LRQFAARSQFGRFQSEADIEANRSEFMGTRRSRCPAWFRAAQPEREEGNNELRTDDRLEIFLHFFAELVVKGLERRKILRA
jgi:hypothetical protein